MLDPLVLPRVADVLAAIRGRSKVDRRQRKRIPLISPVSILVRVAGIMRWVDATTYDVTIAGLGFNSAGELRPKVVFLVLLTADCVKRLILARCVNAAVAVDRSNRIGCEFLAVSTVLRVPPVVPEEWIGRLKYAPSIGTPPQRLPAPPLSAGRYAPGSTQSRCQYFNTGYSRRVSLVYADIQDARSGALAPIPAGTRIRSNPKDPCYAA